MISGQGQKRPNRQGKEAIKNSQPNKISVSSINPQAKEFYIKYQPNENNNSKTKINKYDIYKIFNMIQIPKSEVNSYIAFTFSFIESEILTNTVRSFKIDYKKLKNIINNFDIIFEKTDNSIEVPKYTISKIFNSLSLTPNQRLNLIEFYETEDEAEPQNNNKNKQIHSNNNNIFDNEKLNQNDSNPKNINMNNVKKIIDETENELEKLSKNNKSSEKEKFSKKTKKEKLKNYTIWEGPHIKKRFIKDMNMKTIKNDDTETNIFKLTGIELEIFNKHFMKAIPRNKYKGYKFNKEEDYYARRTFALKNRNKSAEPKKSLLYPFLLRKLPEYEDNQIFLTGSLPVLGNWDLRFAIPMNEEIRNDQIFYTKYIDVKKNEFPFEYRFFYIKKKEPYWIGNPYRNYITHPQFFKLFHTMKKSVISLFDLNIRFINKVDELNIWENRKSKLVQSILNSYSDILFFQEITKIQYEYIDYNLCSVYEFVGVYRDTTDASEKCSISYNVFKYTLNDWGQFWLSSTPYEPCSNDFKNFFPRICTWASLKQINGVDLLFFNVHLDHVNFDAHLKSIKVVLSEIEKIIIKYPETKYVFLGGCFYNEEDDPTVEEVRYNGFKEVMFENTFHDFTGEADRHWDYLFWKELNFEGRGTLNLTRAVVFKEESVVDKKKRIFISDHYPVVAEFHQKPIHKMRSNVKY